MPDPRPDAETGERLQKVLAAGGYGSRRAGELLIGEGRVTVNDEVVRTQGRRVDLTVDVVRVDGDRVRPRDHHRYVALNKPAGVVTTMYDDRGRPTVAELLDTRHHGLFHVGRLDADTTGLLLLTDDGDLAHKLMHPSTEVPKTYLATVPGPVSPETLARGRRGIQLDDGMARARKLRVVDSTPRRALLEVVVTEGRKHLVRRLLAELGHPVQELVRVSVGPVHLGGQKPGATRSLTAEEITLLHRLVGKGTKR